MQTINKNLQECIDKCIKCYEVCRQTIGMCLQKGEKHSSFEHINLLLNCADICQTSANFMLSNSSLHNNICKVCAIVCTKCAEDCESIEEDDKEMKYCAEVCHECAESCKQMSQ